MFTGRVTLGPVEEGGGRIGQGGGSNRTSYLVKWDKEVGQMGNGWRSNMTRG